MYKNTISSKNRFLLPCKFLFISSLLLFLNIGLCNAAPLTKSDSFEDLDILGPFLNRPNSKVENPTQWTLADRIIYRLHEFLPGIPKGQSVRSGRWAEYPDIQNRATSDWGSHSVQFSVFDYYSSEGAKQAIEAIFSDAFKRDFIKYFDKINEDAKQNIKTGKFGGVLTPQEFRSLNLKPGIWISTYTDGFNYEITFLKDIISLKFFVPITQHKRIITGSREKGGTDYLTISLTSDKWMQLEERSCFMIRDQYILAVTVGVTAVQHSNPGNPAAGEGPFVITDQVEYPAAILKQVMSTMNNAPTTPSIAKQENSLEELKKTLSNYVIAKNITTQSISNFQKQVNALNSPDSFNTGSFNEYQNNIMGNDPEWTSKNLKILEVGGWSGVNYLYDKEKWINQLNKSILIQQQNLQKINSEIEKINGEIKNYKRN